MNLDIIKELYEKGLVYFRESFDTWQEAVLASIEPMVNKGYVEKEYGQGIISSAEENGLYIFLAPHICMPHCGLYEFVKNPGFCFVKVNKPIIANPDEPEMGAELFFAIAATEAGEHLNFISKLSVLLSDEQVINTLLSVKNEDDLKKVIYKN